MAASTLNRRRRKAYVSTVVAYFGLVVLCGSGNFLSSGFAGLLQRRLDEPRAWEAAGLVRRLSAPSEALNGSVLLGREEERDKLMGLNY